MLTTVGLQPRSGDAPGNRDRLLSQAGSMISSMTMKGRMPPSWDAFLVVVEQAIAARGYWGGEALRLREAAGRKRLGAAGGRLVVDALEAAGFEVEPEFGEPPRSESEVVMIRRAGGAELAKTIEALLPSIREADRIVPANAMWRDAVVARHALRAWRGSGEA